MSIKFTSQKTIGLEVRALQTRKIAHFKAPVDNNTAEVYSLVALSLKFNPRREAAQNVFFMRKNQKLFKKNF